MGDSAKKIAQINSLENGKGLQYLLNESYRIFGNPSVLFNMEYELVACAENIVTDDYLWNEIVENGVFCSDTINFFKSEDFLDTVASSKTIALLESDKLKYDRIYGRITNSDNNTVIDLIMVACYEPFGDDIPIIFEAFREKLSKEISNIGFFQRYGIVYHETLICKLLDKVYDDKIIFSDHIANLYEGLKTNLFIAVAEVRKYASASGGLEELRDLFKRTQAEHKYAVYSNYIVIIVSSDDKVLDIDRDLNKLASFFECNNIYVGISSRFENLFDLWKHYDEAVDMLTHGIETNSHRRIFQYNDRKEV